MKKPIIVKWLAFSFYNRRLDNANNVIGELYENALNSSVWCIHYYCQKADKKQENKKTNTLIQEHRYSLSYRHETIKRYTHLYGNI